MLTSKKYLCQVLLVFSFFTAESQAYRLDFGAAGAFDAFIFGDMDAAQSDVEGRLAVGGNLTLNNYAIGKLLDNSHGTRDDLVVGGDLTFHNGRVYNGNARSGGVVTLDNTVGFYSTSPASPNGAYISGNSLDFNSIEQQLKQSSLRWSNLAATAVSDMNNYGQLTLRGANLDVNVFSITADELARTNKFTLDIPIQSHALINVSGTSVNLSGFGFYRSVGNSIVRILDNDANSAIRHDGTLTQKVLFNLFQATNLGINGIGIKGSILAPLADSVFYDGHIDGQLIVNSLRGVTGQLSGQVNHYQFIAVIPAPSTLILFSIGGLFLLLRARTVA